MDPLLEEDTPEPQAMPVKEAIRLLEEPTVADGEALQIARFKAIAADPRCKGKMEFAVKLATEAPDMSAEAVGALCDEIPGTVERRLSLAERSRETGAEGITSTPMPEAKTSTAKAMEDAVAKVNARTLSEVPRRAK